MIDAFHGMGHRFLGLGYSTPFMVIKRKKKKERGGGEQFEDTRWN